MGVIPSFVLWDDGGIKMLEEKMRSSIAKIILPLVTILSPACPVGCGEDNQLSKYCCEALKCGEDGKFSVCVEDVDSCYCRQETCCDQLNCDPRYFCMEQNFEECVCRMEPPEHPDYDFGG